MAVILYDFNEFCSIGDSYITLVEDRSILSATSSQKDLHFTALHESRRGIAMRILSIRPSTLPSVCLSNAWIVTKRNKDLSRFLYHTKDHLA